MRYSLALHLQPIQAHFSAGTRFDSFEELLGGLTASSSHRLPLHVGCKPINGASSYVLLSGRKPGQVFLPPAHL